jgi:cation diffusion facilitator CzcD-associated flavoprotein CzcO
VTVSYWTQSLAPTVRPGVDVLVVGAGICGVAAALALQRRGSL